MGNITFDQAVNDPERQWVFHKDAFPPDDVVIWALFEEREVRRIPFCEKLQWNESKKQYRIIDYDPENQEEFLSQFYTVIAWRRI